MESDTEVLIQNDEEVIYGGESLSLVVINVNYIEGNRFDLSMLKEHKLNQRFICNNENQRVGTWKRKMLNNFNVSTYIQSGKASRSL